jgi:hypothetical protein
MRRKQHDRLSLLRAFLDQLRILDANASLHVGRTRAIAIKGFNDQVGKIAVGLLEDRGALELRLLGERVAQICRRQRPAPAEHVVRTPKQGPAQFIQNRQWQLGEELEQELHGMGEVRGKCQRIGKSWKTA